MRAQLQLLEEERKAASAVPLPRGLPCRWGPGIAPRFQQLHRSASDPPHSGPIQLCVRLSEFSDVLSALKRLTGKV